MKHTYLSLLVLFVLALICRTAQAFEFQAPDKPAGGTPQIINGAEVTDPTVWPATFIFRGPLGSCTATAVGSRVILTAAHCIKDGETGGVRISGELIPVQCFHHGGWDQGNATTDFALCLTQTEMTGFPFEMVSTAIAYPRVGDAVVLLGFGCTTAGGHDGRFGTLFTGKATVVRTPQGDDIDTITRGGAAVCFGDSGGATYYVLSPTNGNARALVAVNSRGDINTMSFLSTLATPQFVDWALEWSGDHGVTICGLDVTARGCR